MVSRVLCGWRVVLKTVTVTTVNRRYAYTVLMCVAACTAQHTTIHTAAIRRPVQRTCATSTTPPAAQPTGMHTRVAVCCHLYRTTHQHPHSCTNPVKARSPTLQSRPDLHPAVKARSPTLQTPGFPLDRPTMYAQHRPTSALLPCSTTLYKSLKGCRGSRASRPSQQRGRAYAPLQFTCGQTTEGQGVCAVAVYLRPELVVPPGHHPRRKSQILHHAMATTTPTTDGLTPASGTTRGRLRRARRIVNANRAVSGGASPTSLQQPCGAAHHAHGQHCRKHHRQPLCTAMRDD